ncbi:Molybdenum cofactor synthesis domain protein [uncultured Desulfobacterium sp.]|uniref:Molybdopterin molybdenumtransferase n=1 Tax=uncultured Desulfobacterium sp. TaxID=201089 RepID=A0A445N0W1_9BACT|nr:Molybdenum cofactor synthesis domain protein [uncultured Desulfobacterium sp.]
MIDRYDIGLEKAISITFDRLSPNRPAEVPVDRACGLVAAEDSYALVDCPSSTASLKDGYAVISDELKDAAIDHPVRLRVLGMLGAGDNSDLVLTTGTAIKVMTGASIPEGSDAVVSDEFTREECGWVLCFRDAGPGKNILARGSDVEKESRIKIKGQVLNPAMTGLLAAAGISSIRVYPKPRVGVVATGSEIVAPGNQLGPGQLYASNMVTLVSWLRRFGMEAESRVLPDNEDQIRAAIEAMLTKVDVLLTSGGAWKSERDLTTKILIEMGGELAFHRVRLGPGKAVALIIIADKVVFCLPGGPPSNEMAFLQIALPGLLYMSGRDQEPFEYRRAILSSPIEGDITWTQFYQGRLEERGRQLFVHPIKMKSRLMSQAIADALIGLPEGVDHFSEGDEVAVQVLGSAGYGYYF